MAPPRLEVVEGDLTQQPVDAIVNAANEGLRAGGGPVGRGLRRLAIRCSSEIGLGTMPGSTPQAAAPAGTGADRERPGWSPPSRSSTIPGKC